MTATNPISPLFSAQQERSRRWRLVLGQEQETPESQGEAGQAEQTPGEGLSPEEQQMDQALDTLYGDSKGGDLSDSAPDIARWLGDIRSYFPESVVRILQRDALQRFKLRRVLDEPELLAQIEPDINLVSDILALRKVMPVKTRETAKAVVSQVVEDLKKKLTYPLEQAIKGSLNRATRTRRPRFKEINWQRTIYRNLRHYQPQYQTVIPENLVGYGRKRAALRDIIICLDTSGSMATSVVYGSVYAAVLATIPAVTTKLVLFDTSVVDLSDQLDDPVEMIFGIRLGGGTNIDRAVGYCQGLITRPNETILVLITDLYEGGDKTRLVKRIGALVGDSVKVVTLLALNDKGAPRFDRTMAQEFVNLGVPSFACTPELFPDLMAAVLEDRDLRYWAATHNIVTAPDN
ncbi:MAG: VWA domain-containing protein [Candidatus Promineifilaceae bacterium]|nr:VWA domain-containing protein [Candidatus Promineifilaceae bacterium]